MTFGVAQQQRSVEVYGKADLNWLPSARYMFLGGSCIKAIVSTSSLQCVN